MYVPLKTINTTMFTGMLSVYFILLCQYSVLRLGELKLDRTGTNGRPGNVTNLPDDTPCKCITSLTSIYKFNNWRSSHAICREKNRRLPYLSILLISLSADIEINPGPKCKFPCGNCNKAVKWTDNGLCSPVVMTARHGFILATSP